MNRISIERIAGNISGPSPFAKSTMDGAILTQRLEENDGTGVSDDGRQSTCPILDIGLPDAGVC